MEIDGKFQIAKGQGITQAIVDELGLNKEDLTKMNKRSIWDEIIKIAEDKNSYVEGTKTYDKSMEHSLKVGDTFEFTKAAFQKIINIVNQVTGKGLAISSEVEDSSQEPVGDSTNPQNQNIEPEKVASGIEVKDPRVSVSNNVADAQNLLKDIEEQIKNGAVDKDMLKNISKEQWAHILHKNPELLKDMYKQGLIDTMDLNDILKNAFGITQEYTTTNRILRTIKREAEKLYEADDKLQNMPLNGMESNARNSLNILETIAGADEVTKTTTDIQGHAGYAQNTGKQVTTLNLEGVGKVEVRHEGTSAFYVSVTDNDGNEIMRILTNGKPDGATTVVKNDKNDYVSYNEGLDPNEVLNFVNEQLLQ